MNISPTLRVVLLRSWGLPALVPLAVLEALHVRDRVVPVLEHGRTALDAANGSLILINPLVAALVCAEMLMLTRRGQRELGSVLPDGGVRLVVSRTLATAGWAVALHALTLGGVLLASALRSPVEWTALAPLPPALLSLVAYGAVGACVARLWPSLAAPPLTAGGLFLVALLVERTLPDPLVEFGGATALLVGLRHRPEVLVGQIGWLLVLGVVAVVLGTASHRGYGRLDRRATVGGAVVVCAALGLGSLGDLRFTQASTQEWTCRGHHPQVCVVAAYRERLPASQARVNDVVHDLRLLGLSPPQRFEQAAGTRRSAARDVVTFPLRDADLADTVAYENLVLDVLESMACRQEAAPRWPAINRVTQWASLVHRHPDTIGSSREHRMRRKARTAAHEVTSCG